MMHRITFGQTSASIQRYIMENNFRMDTLMQQLSTGRKLMKPSDDPVGVSDALDLRGALSQNSQYQRNVDGGSAYLSTIDSTVNNNNSLIQRARELAVQGSNDTLTAENRGFIGTEVRSVLDQMIATANTSYRGEFVFSGTNTQVPPYEVRDGAAQISAAELTLATVGQPIQLVDLNVSDSNTTPAGNAVAYHLIPGTFNINGFTEGTDYTVDYINGTITFTPPATAALAAVNAGGGTGTIGTGFSWVRRNEKDLDGVINREIDQNVKARINTTASDVYGANKQDNAYAAMITLLDGLVNNKGNSVRQGMGMMDTALSRNLSAQSTNGARANEFANSQDRAKGKAVDLTDLQSKLEDVDFAEAVSKLSAQQAVYEASLKMGAQAIQHTLMDFM